MPITIKPKLEDYIKVALLSVFEDTKFKRSLWIQRLTLPIIAMLLVLLSKPIVPVNVLFASVLSVLWFIFVPKFFKNTMTKKITAAFKNKAIQDPGMISEYTIDKIEDGLEAKRGDKRFVILFNDLKRCDFKEDYIYLLANGDGFDFLIPSHAFKSKEEFEGFSESLDRQIQISIRK